MYVYQYFVFFLNSSVLEENNLWQKISEEIALKYQPKLGVSL